MICGQEMKRDWAVLEKTALVFGQTERSTLRSAAIVTCYARSASTMAEPFRDQEHQNVLAVLIDTIFVSFLRRDLRSSALPGRMPVRKVGTTIAYFGK